MIKMPNLVNTKDEDKRRFRLSMETSEQARDAADTQPERLEMNSTTNNLINNYMNFFRVHTDMAIFYAEL